MDIYMDEVFEVVYNKRHRYTRLVRSLATNFILGFLGRRVPAILVALSFQNTSNNNS